MIMNPVDMKDENAIIAKIFELKEQLHSIKRKDDDTILENDKMYINIMINAQGFLGDDSAREVGRSFFYGPGKDDKSLPDEVKKDDWNNERRLDTFLFEIKKAHQDRYISYKATLRLIDWGYKTAIPIPILENK